MVEIKMEEQEILEDESYIEQLSDSDWGNIELFFNKENLPEEVKSTISNLPKHLRDGLTEKGVKVKLVRSGMYNKKEVLFVLIDHSIRPTLPQFIKSLNEDYWDCFHTSYIESKAGGDFWGDTDGSKVTAQGRCLVLSLRKIKDLQACKYALKTLLNLPDEVQDKFQENFQQYVENVVKDKKVSVVKVNRMESEKNTQKLYVNINHKNDETFPKLVEDLNVNLWNCLANPKRVQCVLCQIVLVVSEVHVNVNVQSHLKGKFHQKMLKKKADSGVVFNCEVCSVKKFNDREAYQKHMNGAKHLKNTGDRVHECQVCNFKTTDEMSLKDHLKTDEHKKEIGLKDIKSCFSIKINWRLWRCELCDVNSTTDYTVKIHLNGAKHIKNLEILEKTGHVPVKQEKEFRCELCKITTNSKDVLNLHLEGGKHKKKLDQIHRINDLPSNVKIREEGEDFACDLCNIKVTSQSTLTLHLEGAKHKKNKAKQEGGNAVKTASSEVVESEIKCEVCNLNFESEFSFNTHMAGAKHSKKIKQVETENNSNSNNTAEELKSNSSMELCSEQNGKFSCIICGIQTYSENTMQTHLMGAKHKKKLLILEKGGDKVESETNNKNPKVFCNLCSIYTHDETTMEVHIAGSKHRKKLEITGGDDSRKRKVEEGVDGNMVPEKKGCLYNNYIPVVGSNNPIPKQC